MLKSSEFKVESLEICPTTIRRLTEGSFTSEGGVRGGFLFSLFSCFLVSCLFISCGTDSSDKNQNPDSLSNVSTSTSEPKIIEPITDEEIVALTNNGITLTEIKSANNKDANISLNTKLFKEGVNQFQFSVSGIDNYTISYLANNYSLTQFSSSNFEVELLYGNNVFLAFLTDKNNISIKSNKGCVLKNAILGSDVESLFDKSQPHLFYYLPPANVVNPILDFYLVNTSLSKEGNKAKVTINETEFIVNKWAAYQISGLKKPNNTIRIQLVDKNGKLIEGPLNDSGDRVFNLVNKSTKLPPATS